MTGTITIIMGRATADPVIQQGKNSGSEYVSLDFAVNQRGQDGKEETMYYQCYFNSFLAQRLAKAGVRKGTGLLIYGDLEIHPYIYQQGQKAGQPGVNAKITVKDWQFTLSNKMESNAPTGNSAIPNGNPAQNMGNNTPSYGNQQNQGFSNRNNRNAQGANMNYGMQQQQGSYQNGGYPPMMNGNAGANYGAPQGSYPTDGFINVPENAMGQLPFN